MWSFCYGDRMLTLDEKKIRKGKPIGLPYQGSKKKISKKIIEIIKQNFGTDKPIYDVFGGGGAIAAECMLNGLEVHYNDLDKDITDMFQRVISQDREWIKTLIVSRDEFFEIKNKDTKTVDDNLKLLVNSFGNNKSGYLYSKEWSDMKYNLAIEIINKHDVFSGYKQAETHKQYVDSLKNKQIQRLQQLERLEQLEQLQQLQQLEPTNLSYEAFSNIEGVVFYFDPPYEGTKGYNSDKAIIKRSGTEEYNNIRKLLLSKEKGYKYFENGFCYFLGTSKNNKNRMYVKDLQYKNSFDSKRFYDWAFEMSKRNIVLISSYEISDDRFRCVYEFKNVVSTLQGGLSGKKTEKLFMVV